MSNLSLLSLRKDKINQFNKKGIYTLDDLVEFLPRKYYDFTEPKNIKDLKDGEYQAVIGTVIEVNLSNKTVKVKIKDELGKAMGITFFNQAYLAKTIKKGYTYIACGLVKELKEYYGYKTMTNPLVFSNNVNGSKNILPIYSSISGMSSDFLLEKINSAISLVDKDDYLENILMAKYDLIPRVKAVRYVHQPKTMTELEMAKNRILFDDLFLFNFKMKNNTLSRNNDTDINIKTFKFSKKLIDSLPFELTMGQRATIRNIVNKMKENKQVNSLVMGDVGCGKTLVAILLLTVICENGHQGCLVAPTNILAKQHFNEAKSLLEPLGFKVGFISSSLKKSEEKAILKELKEGSIDVVVGTHSLMSSKVEFSKLGLAIIDEEHRFGVKQRDSFNIPGVHKVSMSATPIPRSLAMSLYGDDIQIETIANLPKGRKPIETTILPSDKNTFAYEKMLEELKSGKQCYIVCPLISKSESDKMGNVMDINSEFEKAQKFFSKHGYSVGMASGDMKEEELSDTLKKFKDNEIQILIATTIIEVGVNVPNATVISIVNAERFGFAQLHQLRGRVGRGSDKSYCYLITDTPSKFDIFSKSTDGFVIAKEDLKLRGAGSFLGTAQSGENKYLMLMLGNEELNASIKKDIDEIFKDTSRLKRYKAIFNKTIEEI